MAKPKYAHLIGKLPKLPAENPAYQDRVEATKQAILAPSNGEASSGHLADIYIRVAEDHMKIAHEKLLRLVASQRSSIAFASAYAELRALKDRVEGWLSNTNLLLEAYAQLMVDQMEAEGVTGLRLDGVGNISMTMEPSPKILDEEAFRQWCNADADLRRKMRLMPSTAAMLIKSMLLAGEPTPPGIEVYARTKVSLTRSE